MTDSELKSYVIEPASGLPPKQIVIFLHGLGANGMDLLGLGKEWANDIPDTVFVSPDAPFPCDMAPVGYQWFSLQQWTEEAILAGIKQAAPILNEFIDDQLEIYNLSDENLALVGFSQGTMMSLYTAPRREKPCAGVLGYSGALIAGEELESSKNIVKMPVHLLHGDTDPIVPVQEYHKAKSELEKAGFPVSGEVFNKLEHGINEQGIISGANFLKKIF